MPLSPNEIRSRAASFSREWAGQGYEKGQPQLFYRESYDVFGVPVMPPKLHKAHEALDRAVDRRSGFRFERERVEHLFKLFEGGAAPLDKSKTRKGCSSRKATA